VNKWSIWPSSCLMVCWQNRRHVTIVKRTTLATQYIFPDLLKSSHTGSRASGSADTDTCSALKRAADSSKRSFSRIFSFFKRCDCSKRSADAKFSTLSRVGSLVPEPQDQSMFVFSGELAISKLHTMKTKTMSPVRKRPVVTGRALEPRRDCGREPADCGQARHKPRRVRYTSCLA
jgi:hypothetical protein